MTGPPHPAESPEFLSRLHDGDLSAAEAREFERHRAACPECRQAADEFERSLRAFRASPTAAPASDLSARILRKIREQSPSRRPFGVLFGIDVRWAGLFAAAVLVAIIAPALFRREAPRVAPAVAPAPPESLPAHLVDDKTISPHPAPEVKAPERSARAKEPAAAKKTNEQERGRIAADAAPPPAVREEAFAARPSAPSAPAQAPPVASLESRQKAASITPGQAGAAAGFAEPDRAAVRLSIRAIDDYGEAPALDQTVADEALASLSGREFVVLVEADGRVREVVAADAGGSSRKDETAGRRAAVRNKEGSELLALRFAPSERPRRLLVRVR